LQPIIPLNTRQLVTSALLGALLWGVAVLFIRVIAPLGALEGPARLLTYALVIPGTLPFLLVSKRIAGLGAGQVALGVAVMTAAATLLDGIALAWFPHIYGSTVEIVAAAGAVILWGAGVGLVLGFILDR
jgi:hypothetical protein